jgi:hypothetical protein
LLRILKKNEVGNSVSTQAGLTGALLSEWYRSACPAGDRAPIANALRALIGRVRSQPFKAGVMICLG